jgi:hypothetical protein
MSASPINRRITRSMTRAQVASEEQMYEYWIMKDDFSEPQRIVQNTKLTLNQLQSFVEGNIEIQSIKGMQMYFLGKLGMYAGLCKDYQVPEKFQKMHWVVMNENPAPNKQDFMNDTVYSNFAFEVCGCAVLASENCFDF